MKIIRSDKPYQEIYFLLKSLKLLAYDEIKEYDDIDWEKIAIPSSLLKINIIISKLNRIEFEMIINKEVYKFSDERIRELDLLIWLLAKLQTEYDIVDEYLKKR